MSRTTTKTAKGKTHRYENLDDPRWSKGSKHIFNAVVVTGSHIEISGAVYQGEKKTGEKSPLDDIYAACVDAGPGDDSWLILHDAFEEFSKTKHLSFIQGVLNRIADGTNNDFDLRTVENYIEAEKPTRPRYRLFNRTFHIGDTVEVGSYNLVYTAKITRITAKSVFTDNDYSTCTTQFKLWEFINRNWNLDLAAINKQNSEWMD